MPRIALLTRYDTKGASSRVRSLQYLPILESSGLDIHHFPLMDNEYLVKLYAKQPTRIHQIKRLWKRIREMPSIARRERFDLLWIEKELLPYLPYGLEKWLLGQEVPYMLDFDDAIFHHYDLSPNPFVRLMLGKKLDHLMNRAKVVNCGNGYLAARARSAGAQWVEQMPSTIDFEKYRPLPPPVQAPISADNPLRVIWIGSPSTARYLELVRPALVELSKRYPLELRIIGSTREWDDVKIVPIQWSSEIEAPELNKAHIGIMPLHDTPWEHGKCGFKLIQCMAAGLPVIGSGVGMNNDIVESGKNGFLANSTEDWIQHIDTLAQSPELRSTMGAYGRTLAESRYSIAAVGPQLAALLTKAASGA